MKSYTIICVLLSDIFVFSGDIGSAQTVSTDSLIQDYEFYNSMCRGGSGDEEGTWEACGARNYILYTLNRLGVCYGKSDEAGYQHQWHPCTVGSLRASTRPNLLREPVEDAPTAQVRTQEFNDWYLETGSAISSEGEKICRAVTISQNTDIRLEVARGEGMTTIVFRKEVGTWPDQAGSFGFSLGGFGEFVLGDTLIWQTNSELLKALRAEDQAILFAPDGIPHMFSLSGYSAAIQSLSICD